MKRTPQGLKQDHSAHVDSFCADALPAKELRPEIFLNNLNYPDRMNAAAELLDQTSARFGADRTAIFSPSGDWTYRRLLETSNQIAHLLAEDLGVAPGNRVLLRGPNHPMMAACWMAVLKAGGVVVCTMPLLRKKELVYIAEKAQVDFALVDHRFAEESNQAFACRPGSKTLYFNAVAPIPAVESLDKLVAGKSPEFGNCDTAAEDIAIIAFTSGTTGLNKGTMHSHRDLLAACDTFSQQVLQPTANDIFCGSPPLAFTYGLGGLLLFPFRAGAATLLLEQSTPRYLLEEIQRFRANICFTAPTAYRAMLKLLDEFDIACLQKCVSAGETLPLDTFRAWQQATGHKIIDGIGSTEMLHIFISAANDDIRPGATGKVVPGYEAKLIDADGKTLPAGEIGHLAVRGPTGCRYLHDLEQQKKYVRDGWNVTGDSYRMDADGYFWYQARTDDMIVSSGYNISAPEVENVLLCNPKVAECAVIGVPDIERGQLVKAFVVLAAGAEPVASTAKELQDYVKAEIAPYKYPRALEFVKSLPRTATGKLQRGRLRELMSTTHALKVHQPAGWPRPRGYENAVSAHGRCIFLAGQVGWDPVTSKFASDDLVQQVRQCLQNIVAALGSAGAKPEHLVRLTWFVTDKKAYLAAQKEIGVAYREVIGKHFPAMSVVEVSALIEDRAKVEIEATAVAPE